jgi:hypothetical protein
MLPWSALKHTFGLQGFVSLIAISFTILNSWIVERIYLDGTEWDKRYVIGAHFCVAIALVVYLIGASVVQLRLPTLISAYPNPREYIEGASSSGGPGGEDYERLAARWSVLNNNQVFWRLVTSFMALVFASALVVAFALLVVAVDRLTHGLSGAYP